ncbi:SURF1 family protein [Oceanospirillum multiglobuliferum]|nr:SURF1 family protein [Oceanospirillum multiglobuliferum]SJZ60018.1 SURF1 family protein [Oceanospirillum multiglobuliferum]
MILVIILCTGLGFWQLERATEKTILLEQIRQGRLHPESANELLQQIRNAQIRPYAQYRVSGYYQSQYSFLLDNRTDNGRVGYHLLTPFLLATPSLIGQTDTPWLLINRGWIAAPRLRGDLPIINTPTGLVEVQVQLNLLQPIADTEQLDLKWPLRVQKLDLTQFSEQIQHSLLPYEFRLADAGQAGVALAQPARPALQPDQHMGYAVQWFMLALVFSLLWSYPLWRGYIPLNR